VHGAPGDEFAEARITMLKKLRRFFEDAGAEPGYDDRTHLHVCVATLLHESKRVDFGEHEAEHAAALRAMHGLFGLDAAAAEPLLGEGREKARALESYFGPVGVIKRAFSLEQRIGLVEHLWRIAYADGRLDRDEDHFVRKISHLLHVPNTECMLARSRARPKQ
jgi:uncharacterized tellurite resistance protein B-like protein